MKIPVAIVDDKSQNRISLAEKINYSDDTEVVLSAASGDDFLEKMKHLRVSEHPLVVLMDIEMPGMTGVELAAQLSKERPDTKVLLLSGVANGLVVPNNGWQFLPKPFMPETLQNGIRGFLCMPNDESTANG